MEIETGKKPPRMKSESADKEKALIKEIVNKLELSEEANNWLHTNFEVESTTRFRAAFNRYLLKYNDASSQSKEFTWEQNEDNKTGKIWRIR